MNLLIPTTGILTIAQDDNQNIYSITRNWKELGIRRLPSEKELYITTDSVTVSTVHSVKGFVDYAAVFVLCLDLFDQSRWTEEEITCLTYVAITRARFRLYIPYLSGNEVVKNFSTAGKLI